MFLLENQRNFLKTVPFPTLSPEELGLLEHTVSLLVRSLLLLESWQLIINKTKKNLFPAHTILSKSHQQIIYNTIYMVFQI